MLAIGLLALRHRPVILGSSPRFEDREKSVIREQAEKGKPFVSEILSQHGCFCMYDPAVSNWLSVAISFVCSLVQEVKNMGERRA